MRLRVNPGRPYGNIPAPAPEQYLVVRPVTHRESETHTPQRALQMLFVGAGHTLQKSLSGEESHHREVLGLAQLAAQRRGPFFREGSVSSLGRCCKDTGLSPVSGSEMHHTRIVAGRGEEGLGLDEHIRL